MWAVIERFFYGLLIAIGLFLIESRAASSVISLMHTAFSGVKKISLSLGTRASRSLTPSTTDYFDNAISSELFPVGVCVALGCVYSDALVRKYHWGPHKSIFMGSGIAVVTWNFTAVFFELDGLCVSRPSALALIWAVSACAVRISPATVSSPETARQFASALKYHLAGASVLAATPMVWEFFLMRR